MSEEKEVYGVDNEIVDLDVMINAPVPFAKAGGKVYSIKALTAKEAREYGKVLFLGPPVYTVVNDEIREIFIKCFNSHVFDENEKPVKFEDVEDKWPDESIKIFTKAILRLSD